MHVAQQLYAEETAIMPRLVLLHELLRSARIYFIYTAWCL